jgi:hypothetical protein
MIIKKAGILKGGFSPFPLNVLSSFNQIIVELPCIKVTQPDFAHTFRNVLGILFLPMSGFFVFILPSG